MRNLLVMLLCLTFSITAMSATTPAATLPVAPMSLSTVSSTVVSPLMGQDMSRKSIEKALGRKLKFKERIALKLYKISHKKNSAKPSDASLQKKARWSLILGIAAMGLIFLPAGPLLSIGAIITALILGYQVRKEDPTNKTAKWGIIMAYVSIAVFLAFIGVAIGSMHSL